MPTPERFARLLAAALAAAACSPASGDRPDDDVAASDAPPIVLDTLASPAPAGSAEPNIAAGPDGLYLSWLEQTGEGRHALRFARLGEDGWSAPRTVMERTGLFVNWADFPSVIALDGGLMAAHWLEKSGAGTYAYDVRTAVSTDGGRTWGADVIPHGDGVETEHGFVSLFPVDGRIGAVWLDGRAMHEGQPMALRFATLGPDGATPDEPVDLSVCDCCQTGAALTSEGPVVVYRDRTEGEIRDIYAVRRVDGAWTEPRAVHEDDWLLNACPVNGPAVDAEGRRVVVAWFTGSPSARVLVAFSDDAGATFGAPIRADLGEPQGRVDVVLLESGAALVSWLEIADGRAEIRLREVTDSAGPVLRLAETSAARASGFPRMARLGDRVLFAWTQAGDPPRVRTAVGRLTGAEANR